jgi:hypothetical protein
MIAVLDDISEQGRRRIDTVDDNIDVAIIEKVPKGSSTRRNHIR